MPMTPEDFCKLLEASRCTLAPIDKAPKKGWWRCLLPGRVQPITGKTLLEVGETADQIYQGRLAKHGGMPAAAKPARSRPAKAKTARVRPAKAKPAMADTTT